MPIENKTFCWNGFITTDAEKTYAFFPRVLGWGTEEAQMGDETMKMFTHGGKAVGHLRAPAMEGEPSWWNNYLRVENVDESAAKIVEHGGKVLVPGTDIPPGRFSTVTTPSGATFTLFREAGDDDSSAAPGAIGWVDLHSHAIDKDLAFLQEALGIGHNTMPMPDGAYYTLKADKDLQAGAMTSMHAEAPSMWMAWVNVEDVEATLGRVAEHGGVVVAPAWDVPGVGRLAIAQDPAGIVFGLLKGAK